MLEGLDPAAPELEEFSRLKIGVAPEQGGDLIPGREEHHRGANISLHPFSPRLFRGSLLLSRLPPIPALPFPAAEPSPSDSGERIN